MKLKEILVGLDTIIREVKEETNLDVEEKNLELSSWILLFGEIK